jgi:uncharacterized protein (DUF924 family)
MEIRSMDVVSRVLNFWYDEDALDLVADGDYRMAWFKKDNAFDEAIRDQFEADVRAAANGNLDDLKETTAGVLALCILLDQFPRNLYRGLPQAFATDLIALATAKDAIDRGVDQKLGKTRRMFLYLPFEHSENLDNQNTSVELFKASNDEQSYLYALEHYYVISRFGRFPGRNAALGRESSKEEFRFLEEFGAY